MFSGVSLEQAPPIKIPFLFFAFAFVGLVVFGVYGLCADVDIGVYNQGSISLLHIFTTLFVAPLIFGAVSQMLPVIVGAVVSSPMIKYMLTLFFWLSGVLLLLLYFLSSSVFVSANVVQMLTLASAFIFGFSIIFAIIKSKIINNYSIGFMSVGLFFIVGIFFGTISIENRLYFEIHAFIMIVGVVFLLIYTVFQRVVPMFWVSAEYPLFCKKSTLYVLIGIVGAFVFERLTLNIVSLWVFVTLLIWPIGAFVSITILRLKNRKRKIFDPTVLFFYTGLSLFGIAYSGFLYSIIFNNHIAFILSIWIFFTGFLLSISLGILFKVIPFLSWFHLINVGVYDANEINNVLTKNIGKKIYMLYAGFLLFFFGSFFVNNFKYLSFGFLLVLVFLFMFSFLKIYRVYISKQPK